VWIGSVQWPKFAARSRPLRRIDRRSCSEHCVISAGEEFATKILNYRVRRRVPACRSGRLLLGTRYPWLDELIGARADGNLIDETSAFWCKASRVAKDGRAPS